MVFTSEVKLTKNDFQASTTTRLMYRDVSVKQTVNNHTLPTKKKKITQVS